MAGVTPGFIPEPLSVPVINILPSRCAPAGVIESRKFKQIRASIQEVGLIEPLSGTSADQTSGRHVLLDGHLRLIALQDLGLTAASCLVSTDDETYTYNNRINRLSTIQEHYMIRRAVERGVSPDRLAKATRSGRISNHQTDDTSGRHLHRGSRAARGPAILAGTCAGPSKDGVFAEKCG